VLLFGERPSPVALTGAGLVIAGIIVMSWSPGRLAGGGRPFGVRATGLYRGVHTVKQGRTTTPVLYSYGLTWRAC
jgi:hypothetical protein